MSGECYLMFKAESTRKMRLSLPVVIPLSENCTLFKRGVQERLSEDFSVPAGYAQGRREDTRLVPATKSAI